MKRTAHGVINLASALAATIAFFSIPAVGLAQSALDTRSPEERKVGSDAEWYHRAQPASPSRILLAQADPVAKKLADLEAKYNDLLAKYDDMRGVVATQRGKVSALTLALGAVQSPNRFLVIAFLKTKKEAEKVRAGFAEGASSGLPTADHDWKQCPAPPCKVALYGNQAFLNRDAVPPNWPGTHMAAKSFESPFEANEWLNGSREGKALQANSEFVVMVTVTDYSKAISKTTPTVEEIKAILLK